MSTNTNSNPRSERDFSSADSDVPETTLTQRRTRIQSSGSKKLTQDKLDHSDDMPSDRQSVVRIALWILIIVIIGIGSAILIANIIRNENQAASTAQENAQTNEPESFPVVITDPTTDDSDVNEDEDDSFVIPQFPPLTDNDVDNDIDEEEEPSTTPVIGAGLISEYASTNRELSAENSTKSLILSKFRFFETASEFNYNFSEVGKTTAGQIDPDIDLFYEGNNVVVRFNNVSSDKVTGNENTTSRSITNIVNITGTETQNTNGVSTYKFLMTKKVPSRVVVDKNTNEITIQIQNRS